MKIERLLSIIILLLSHSVVTAKEMAERFHVSKRTIYRDITTLENAGFPIIAIYGNEGGFRLINEFKLHTYTFSEEEKNWLLQALELQSELFTINSVAQTVREKLRLLLLNETPMQLTVEQGTLHHHSIEQQTKVKIQKIQQVMKTKNKIQINYISSNGQQTSRKVSPLQLSLKNGSWYLNAFCELRKACRAFKLTRIRKIEELDERMDKNKSKELLTEKIEIEPKMICSKQTIVCLFSANQLGKLVDFFSEDQIDLVSNNKLKVTFEEDSTKNIVPFLLMFGANVCVIEPIQLKEAHSAAIQAMTHVYPK